MAGRGTRHPGVEALLPSPDLISQHLGRMDGGGSRGGGAGGGQKRTVKTFSQPTILEYFEKKAANAPPPVTVSTDVWMEPGHSEWMGCVGGTPAWRVVWRSGEIETRGPRGEVLWRSAVMPPWSRSHYDSNYRTNKFYGGDERYRWTQAEWFAGPGAAPVHVLVR